MKISHLFFADDLLLFAEATPEQAWCIREGLENFCKASGQKVSFNKSLLFVSPNVRRQAAEELSNILQVPLTEKLGRYLGHDLIHKGWSGHLQGTLIQKAKRKLEGWKSSCLSRAGRLTMAKAVLNNIANFHMQGQRLSAGTHRELDRLVQQCIWGSSTLKNKVHLLGWDVLCKPKSEGGAGLRRAEDMNRCLLAKLGWRILTCERETWCKVMRSKYNVQEESSLLFRNKQRQSNIWRGLFGVPFCYGKA